MKEKHHSRPHLCCSLFLKWTLALAVSQNCGWAQVTAAVSGRVEDASGAAVHGAVVSVKHLETGVIRVGTTDEAGNYAFSALAVGPLELKAEKQGFKTAVRSGINLKVGQHALVNLRLEVGEFVQQVTVSEELPLVNANQLERCTAKALREVSTPI